MQRAPSPPQTSLWTSYKSVEDKHHSRHLFQGKLAQILNPGLSQRVCWGLRSLDLLPWMWWMLSLFTREKNEKALSEIKGFLWMYLRGKLQLNRRKITWASLCWDIIQKQVLGTWVNGKGSGDSEGNLYKGSNSPLEQLQGISALSEQQMHCQGYGKGVYLIFALTNYYLYGRNAEVSWDWGPAVWSNEQALLWADQR